MFYMYGLALYEQDHFQEKNILVHKLKEQKEQNMLV